MGKEFCRPDGRKLQKISVQLGFSNAKERNRIAAGGFAVLRISRHIPGARDPLRRGSAAVIPIFFLEDICRRGSAAGEHAPRRRAAMDAATRRVHYQAFGRLSEDAPIEKRPVPPQGAGRH